VFRTVLGSLERKVAEEVIMFAAVSCGCLHDYQKCFQANCFTTLQRSLERILHPLHCSNWKSPATCQVNNKTIDQIIDDPSKTALYGEEEEHVTCTVTEISPNVLSCFLETSGAPFVCLIAPRVNHRRVHVQSVWWDDGVGTKSNLGIIGIMLRFGDDPDICDAMFTKINFRFFPYKSKEISMEEWEASKWSDADSVPALSQSVFAQHDRVQQGGSVHMASHLTQLDWINLAYILSKVTCSHAVVGGRQNDISNFLNCSPSLLK
jgi:hypothetical protein